MKVLKKGIVIICLIFSVFLSAQNEKTDDKDQLIEKMCYELKNSENQNDSVRFTILKEKYILPYLNKFPAADRRIQNDNLYFRFQKMCEHFRDFLSRSKPIKNKYWTKVDIKPEITVTNKEILELKNSKNLYYFEYSGKKTLVKTDTEFWIETFTDDTYSKLFYRWIGFDKFELEFIESNNKAKKNFSKKGEKFIYEVINKENNYFWVLVEIPGQSRLVKFKLFEEK